MSKGKEVIGGPVMVGQTTLPMSMAVRAGDFVFLSGMLSMDEAGNFDFSGDITEQTRLTLSAIERLLAQAGCTRDDVVKSVVYLKDRGDFGAFNAAYGAFFDTAPPVRTAICTDFVVEGVRVEIDVTAYAPQQNT